MEQASNKCCEQPLNEDELNCLEAFERSSSLNEFEKSSLYFIFGYVAFKENMKCVDAPITVSDNDSEFTNQQSCLNYLSVYMSTLNTFKIKVVVTKG